MPEYDPSCYLCPGNARAGGAVNPEYTGTYTFVNDFSALLPDAPEDEFNRDGLLRAKGERGLCKVICFSPRHDLTLARMSPAAVRGVIDVWSREYEEIGAQEFIRYVQIFENRGAMMGCSNPHPHGQIWSNSSIPDLPAKETEMQLQYRSEKGGCLLCDYLSLESESDERIVVENDGFLVVVPFWALWPFEVMILPKAHQGSILEMSDRERDLLADVMRRIGIRFDNLFETNFPYSMGFHQKPTDGEEHPEWHWHIHYLPPLLRSATVKKFMVGYELLTMPQRDITAEGSAERLRNLPETHFMEKTT